MTAYAEWFARARADRADRGLRRELVARAPRRGVLDLASNDYLGLARDRRVVQAAADAAATWGAGSTGSRLVTGTTALHVELEDALATFARAEAALAFSSGYAANLAVLQALADEDTLVVSDRGNHASLIDGCRLAKGRLVVAPHGDIAYVDDALARRDSARAIVVTDAVFSVDGDRAPLRELHDACARHDALLVVDEAHAFGVLGPGGAGLAVEAGIVGSDRVVRTVTFSKALGAQGGAVLASADVVEHLVNTARTLIFDTALAPPCAGAALASLRILDTTPALPDAACRRAAQLADALDVDAPAAAIVSVIVGEADAAHRTARRCLDKGVHVGCFRPPSVPAGTSRLRLVGRADLTDADVATAADVVAHALAQPS